MKNCNYYHHNGYTIPSKFLRHIEDYVELGRLPGGFLQGVITNNFRHVALRVPDTEISNLCAYAHYFYTKVPAECFGSKENMRAWVAKGGKKGKEKVKGE